MLKTGDFDVLFTTTGAYGTAAHTSAVNDLASYEIGGISNMNHRQLVLEKEDGKTGIGLGNIFRRIRAMYQDGNVEIYSKKDVGTVVKIQIRHKEVGEHDVPCVGGGR